MTKNKTNYIQEHFKGHESFISRLDDYIHQAHSYRKVFTPFLSSLEQEILKKYIGKEVYYSFDGGYPGAEYKRAFLYEVEEETKIPVVCLKTTYHTKYHSLNHRDVLGSLMNLGVKRSQFGDIFVDDGNIYIYVCEEISLYVIQELKKIKHCHVEFETYEGSVAVEVEMSYTTHTISSFRLDVVVGAITRLSREKAKKIILAKNVKVNHLPLEECAYICNNESVISIRGYGRFKLIDLNRVMKSNRNCIEIGKYE